MAKKRTIHLTLSAMEDDVADLQRVLNDKDFRVQFIQFFTPWRDVRKVVIESVVGYDLDPQPQPSPAEVKAAVEEGFTNISLDDMFAVKGWQA